ncbi:MAG: hypothetical protein JWQ10_3145 [Herbaspirillum sp.]|jgi:hypothetical protein|nr:hypothetical protein [Herbaspirillum sp.]
MTIRSLVNKYQGELLSRFITIGYKEKYPL